MDCCSGTTPGSSQAPCCSSRPTSTFLLLTEALGRSGAFWFYGAIGILTLIFCWKLVPETKGKRLEDIQAYFQERVDRHA